MSAPRHRAVALILLVAHVGACTTWRPTTLSPQELLAEEQPSRIRVTRADGTVLLMSNPGIVGDSIQSGCDEGNDPGCLLRVRSVSIRNVRSVEVRSTDYATPAVVLALVGVVAFVLAEQGGDFYETFGSVR